VKQLFKDSIKSLKESVILSHKLTQKINNKKKFFEPTNIDVLIVNRMDSKNN
jgi:hypothetical protein